MNKKIVASELMKIAKDLASADTFKCPDCGSKVLEQTKYCVKCKKKVKKASRSKVAKQKQLGFNQSTWGPEDANEFTHTSFVWLVMNSEGNLHVIAEDKVDGRKSQKNYPVGNIENPNIGAIDSILKKHQPTKKKDANGYPFSDRWVSNKKSNSLKGILSDELKVFNGPREALRKSILRHVEKMELGKVEPLARVLGVI